MESAKARGEFLAELKLPAEREFIPPAKRVGACLGSQLGFSIEEIDELGIAIAQACDSTIEACEEIWGDGSGATMKLSYARTERGIAVDVEATAPSGEALARRHARRDPEMQRLAQEMIRFFVNDFQQSVDAGRGRVHLRMVKDLIG